MTSNILPSVSVVVVTSCPTAINTAASQSRPAVSAAQNTATDRNQRRTATFINPPAVSIMNPDQGIDELGKLLQACASRPQLCSYDGTSSIESFLTVLEAVYDELQLNDALCVRSRRQALRGDAKLFFTQCLKDDKATGLVSDVAEWTVRLRNRFKRPITSSSLN